MAMTMVMMMMLVFGSMGFNARHYDIDNEWCRDAPVALWPPKMHTHSHTHIAQSTITRSCSREKKITAAYYDIEHSLIRASF